MNNARLFQKAKRLMPKGVNSPVRYFDPYPFFIKSAKGCKIKDVENNEYIDYCMGYGALLLGHAFKDVTNAAKEQLKDGTLFCTPTEKEVELAELLHKCIPSAEMVRLMNTGSEATMHAIRLARAYTKKSKIVKFEGCYHGAYDYVLVKAGSGALEQKLLLSEGMLDCVADNTLVLPYNDIESVEELFKKEDDIACIILEPIIANMGLILPKDDYLHKLAKIAKENDTLLIFDEVVTGFRLALGGAQEYYGIKPDLATFAKAISNGFVISALVGKKEIMSNLAPEGNVYQASTFAGNPLSVSASIANIEFLRKKKIYKQLEKHCKAIADAMRDYIKDYKINARVNNIASMFQIFFTDREVIDYDTVRSSNTELFKRYFKELLKNKLFIPPSQFETCFISYSHDEKIIKKSIDIIERALRELR
ncbi:MAG: glutamate-1-semialdehyde-2,1-aminomutase [Candidatus Nitrosocaldaceae archaeon]|nr:MAG: glutamate-1-semialdehyde-2,1-aminomutase [Candidatus Nitrosocaldaceae archaeon]